MAGSFASPEPFVPFGPQPGLHVQADDGRGPGHGRALRGAGRPGPDLPTGMLVAGLAELSDADLWITVTEPELVRLTITGGGPLRSGALPLLPFGALAGSDGAREPDWAGDFGVAALIPARLPPPTARGPQFEVAVRGFGPWGGELARRLAGRVEAWNERDGPGRGISVTAYPAGVPVPSGPGQVLVDRRHTRLALSWPAR